MNKEEVATLVNYRDYQVVSSVSPENIAELRQDAEAFVVAVDVLLSSSDAEGGNR